MRPDPLRTTKDEENVGLLQDDIELSPSDTTFIHKPTRQPSRAYLALCAFGRFLWWFFIPGILGDREARRKLKQAKVSPTGYLDGMRGLAAVAVVAFHWAFPYFKVNEGYAHLKNDWMWINKLPGLHLMYLGNPAVGIFFFISGYGLAYKPLKLIRQKKYADLATALSSSVFRRLFRLYLPTAGITAVTAILLQLNAYEGPRQFANDPKVMRYGKEIHPVRQANLWREIVAWGECQFAMLKLFSWDHDYNWLERYDNHLWTIPIEYRSSLFVFLMCLGTARLKTGWRYFCLAFSIMISVRNSRWELALFFCGVGLADWDHIRGAHVPQANLDEKYVAPKYRTLKTVGWWIVSLLGLHLMSYPDPAKETPGYVFLSQHIFEWYKGQDFRPWQSVGNVIYIVAVAHLPVWQKMFNHWIPQYLGKISFSLYLSHAVVMHTVGFRLLPWAWTITGVEGLQLNAGFALATAILIPIFWWAGDLFMRAVEMPSVNFCRWLEGKVQTKND